MSNGKNSNINVPLVIICLVAIVALVGGWWFYNRSKTPPKRNTNSNNPIANQPTNRTPNPMNNAPIGAQPPNYLGAPNASVVIEEFADFQCGSCAAVHPVMQQVKSIYGSRIKFTYRHYPLVQIHQKAYDASVAAEAAGLQGKFWDMQNLLFSNQQSWAAASDHRKVFEEYAQKLGLDVKRFQDDMLGMNAKARVDADIARGRALNITSTPTVYINGLSIPYEQMNVEGLRQIIDAELAKAPQSQTTQTQTTSGAGSSRSSNSNSSSNTTNTSTKK